MPVVKGGVWTNIEDEILKASVSKYGLNQWARVSSLLARKTPKQCKARWTEWLDPGIRKIEWSKEEDEKLLHLAKLMPTQWRTIAPIVGRTATQCLERYQKLLDEAEARENDELGLGGPEGGETAAPSGDQVRKLRPGELDPDPESKPARPDTIDLDEDEKEMLSEARARLANTQGKKAKRKARERQLEESRRLAVLQKRRELKNAGINIKITTRKKGEMDYNADIPFEKQATSGFYDTQEEQTKNERERDMFDPRKQQLARKRQGDPEDNIDPKRQKQDKDKSSAAVAAAAAKAGQMQRLREAEQQSKRRALNLPAPQVSESELEEIIKMGIAGDRAVRAAGQEDGDDRGLISNYSNMVGATPIRTPRAPAQEDHIANEIKNIRALTETQSSLLGGENTPMHEGSSSTGFDGIAPRRNEMVTPNPMATPLRQAGAAGQFPSATPLRTPRDNLTINEKGERQLIPQTPRDMRLAENVARQSVRAKLASLPKPKESEWELEVLPSEQEEATGGVPFNQEDQEEIDRREREAREAAAAAELKRQTQVYQRALPRPVTVDYNTLASDATSIPDPIRAMIAQEAALLIANDARKFPLPGSRLVGKPPQTTSLSDDLLARARQQLKDACTETNRQSYVNAVLALATSENERDALPSRFLPNTTPEEYISAFKSAQQNLLSAAEAGNKLEKKLSLHLGGYQARQKTLKQKIASVYGQIEEQRAQLDSFRTLQISEEGALARRLERLRDEVNFVMRREREAQEDYRAVREELREVEGGARLVLMVLMVGTHEERTIALSKRHPEGTHGGSRSVQVGMQHPALTRTVGNMQIQTPTDATTQRAYHSLEKHYHLCFPFSFTLCTIPSTPSFSSSSSPHTSYPAHTPQFPIATIVPAKIPGFDEFALSIFLLQSSISAIALTTTCSNSSFSNPLRQISIFPDRSLSCNTTVAMVAPVRSAHFRSAALAVPWETVQKRRPMSEGVGSKLSLYVISAPVVEMCSVILDDQVCQATVASCWPEGVVIVISGPKV